MGTFKEKVSEIVLHRGCGWEADLWLRAGPNRSFMHIRHALETDIPYMVAIAEVKRVEYEGYSPIF